MSKSSNNVSGTCANLTCENLNDRCPALTGSLQGDLAGLTGTHYDNTLNPREGGKVGIRDQVPTQSTDR